MRYITIILILLSGLVKAQTPSFTTAVDSNTILIGEQIKLLFEAQVEPESSYSWPIFNDSIEGLEMISASAIDTIKENGIWKLQQELIITSFDTGYFLIPPFIFTSKGLSTESPAIGIAVGFPEFSEDVELYDIKDPLDVKLNFWWILLWNLLAGIALALAIWLFRSMKRKKAVGEIKIQENLPPPDVQALQLLMELKEESLWQKGEIKSFYSRLIDILRIYLQRQLQVNAMESTAEEIIDALTDLGLSRDYFDQLKSTLRISALVKFAKVKPTGTENEEALPIIRKFIEITRPQTQEKTAENVD